MAVAAPAAAVDNVSLQTRLEDDMRALVDNFEGMLRSAQARYASHATPPLTLTRRGLLLRLRGALTRACAADQRAGAQRAGKAAAASARGAAGACAPHAAGRLAVLRCLQPPRLTRMLRRWRRRSRCCG